MSNGFKAEWDKHQSEFLALMLKELEALDVNFKRKLEGFIDATRPRKVPLIGRLKSFLGMSKPDAEESRKTAIFKQLQKLIEEIFGSKGRETYVGQRETYLKDCLAKISQGKSISSFVEDFALAAADPRKTKRFIHYFSLLTFNTPKEIALGELCKFHPRQSFEYEYIAGIWKLKVEDHKPVDAFRGFNETLGFAALDKIFADAGGLVTTIAAGTSCSHAGVLPKCLVLDDNIPCWTTTDQNKAINYARIAVTTHVTKPTNGSFPQIINGVVDNDLHCGVMHGTSFDEFTRVFCGTSHAHLKAWIASWCEEPGRNFDGLVGTNGGADELVIMKPWTNVSWSPWLTLPLTKVGFDRKYGHPPSFSYQAPKPTPVHPPSSSPTPTGF